MDFCILGRCGLRMIRSFGADEGLKIAGNQWFTVKHNLPGSQKSADFPLETFSSFFKEL
jgi:hypothetical protein